MSTRGLFGFRIDDEYYMSFSPTDSYPNGLGKYWHSVVKNEFNLEHMKSSLLNSTVIDVHENDGAKGLAKSLAEKENIPFDEADKIIDEYDEVAKNNDEGPFKAIHEGRLNLFFNDKEFMGNTLFCEFVYYYDYDIEKFVMIDNHEGMITELPLEDERWQKKFSVI